MQIKDWPVLLIVAVVVQLSVVALASSSVQWFKGTEEAPTPTFVLIMDDMGLHWQRGLEALALPGPVSFAFLPYGPYVKPLATYAHQLDKEVMLHMPMANARQMPLGEGALTPNQDEHLFKARLQSALLAVPYVRGINNHMGSLLTTQTLEMTWLMEVLSETSLFFVDSRTTSRSIAYDLAKDKAVPALVRDVFLDHDRDVHSIHKQFQKAIEICQRYGSVVVIGHPYSETLDYLKSALPRLAYLGISQATASALIQQQNADLAMVAFRYRGGVSADALAPDPLDLLVEDIRSTHHPRQFEVTKKLGSQGH